MNTRKMKKLLSEADKIAGKLKESVQKINVELSDNTGVDLTADYNQEYGIIVSMDAGFNKHSMSMKSFIELNENADVTPKVFVENSYL